MNTKATRTVHDVLEMYLHMTPGARTDNEFFPFEEARPDDKDLTKAVGAQSRTIRMGRRYVRVIVLELEE